MPRDIRALEEEAEVAKKPEYLHEYDGMGQDVSCFYVSPYHVLPPLLAQLSCILSAKRGARGWRKNIQHYQWVTIEVFGFPATIVISV